MFWLFQTESESSSVLSWTDVDNCYTEESRVYVQDEVSLDSLLIYSEQFLVTFFSVIEFLFLFRFSHFFLFWRECWIYTLR